MVFTRMKMLGADIPEDDRFLELSAVTFFIRALWKAPTNHMKF